MDLNGAEMSRKKKYYNHFVWEAGNYLAYIDILLVLCGTSIQGVGNHRSPPFPTDFSS